MTWILGLIFSPLLLPLAAHYLATCYRLDVSYAEALRLLGGDDAR